MIPKNERVFKFIFNYNNKFVSLKDLRMNKSNEENAFLRVINEFYFLNYF